MAGICYGPKFGRICGEAFGNWRIDRFIADQIVVVLLRTGESFPLHDPIPLAELFPEDEPWRQTST